MYKAPAKNRHRNNVLFDDLAKIKRILAETARDVRGKTAQAFTHSIENVKDRSHELQENTANYIAEKPFMTIGVALLSGLCIGYILKRRNSHWKHR